MQTHNEAGTVPPIIEPDIKKQKLQHGTAQALTFPVLQEQLSAMKQQMAAMAEMMTRLTVQGNQPPAAVPAQNLV